MPELACRVVAANLSNGVSLPWRAVKSISYHPKYKAVARHRTTDAYAARCVECSHLRAEIKRRDGVDKFKDGVLLYMQRDSLKTSCEKTNLRALEKCSGLSPDLKARRIANREVCRMIKSQPPALRTIFQRNIAYWKDRMTYLSGKKRALGQAFVGQDTGGACVIAN